MTDQLPISTTLDVADAADLAFVLGPTHEVVAAVLILIGAFFCLIAGLGVLRMPDIYCRMHAASKAGTLGVGMILIGTALVGQELEITTRAAMAILFLFLTVPVASHLLGRAAYMAGVRPCKTTHIDELEGHYAPHTGELD
ncbi:MAG: monovalent cation/H(+) antiporter subunit G [Alphaproteobacteria bacterium]